MIAITIIYIIIFTIVFSGLLLPITIDNRPEFSVIFICCMLVFIYQTEITSFIETNIITARGVSNASNRYWKSFISLFQ